MADETRKRIAMGLLSPPQKGPNRGLLDPGLMEYQQQMAQGLLGQAVQDVYGQNRGLARYQDMYNVTQKPTAPDDPRQIEYYPPWERDNPTPGKATLEAYRVPSDPAMARNLIQGDMMHLTGSVDPRTRQPIDPTFRSLKQEFMGTLTPEQLAIDRRAYQSLAPLFKGNPPPFEDWMDESRVDAYIRGYLTPDERDEWRKSGAYTKQQIEVLEKMRKYLQRGSLAPGMQR